MATYIDSYSESSFGSNGDPKLEGFRKDAFNRFVADAFAEMKDKNGNNQFVKQLSLDEFRSLILQLIQNGVYIETKSEDTKLVDWNAQKRVDKEGEVLMQDINRTTAVNTSIRSVMGEDTKIPLADEQG